MIRDSPASIADLARAGTATSLQGIGKTIQEKIVALLDEGEIPAAQQAQGEVPGHSGRRDATAGRRREDGAPALRRARDRDARRARGRRRPRSACATSRGSARSSSRTCSPRSRSSESTGPSERRLLSEVLEVGGELVAALLASPASDRVELAGSARRWAETCKDIDIVATATDPEALIEVLLEHPIAAEGGSSGIGRGADPHPQRDRGRSADRPAGRVRQPAPALHRLEGAQRRRCASAR